MPKFNPDLTKPFTDEELRTLVIDGNGNGLFAFDALELQKAKADSESKLPVLHLGSQPCDKALYLLRAAPYMYQNLGLLFQHIEQLLSMTESVNAENKKRFSISNPFLDALEVSFTEMQNRIMEARRVAVEGPTKLVGEIKRGQY